MLKRASRDELEKSKRWIEVQIEVKKKKNEDTSELEKKLSKIEKELKFHPHH